MNAHDTHTRTQIQIRSPTVSMLANLIRKSLPLGGLQNHQQEQQTQKTASQPVLFDLDEQGKLSSKSIALSSKSQLFIIPPSNAEKKLTSSRSFNMHLSRAADPIPIENSNTRFKSDTVAHLDVPDPIEAQFLMRQKMHKNMMQFLESPHTMQRSQSCAVHHA